MDEAEVRIGLPEPDEHGDRATWTFEDQDGVTHTITGSFLGMGSSHWHEHTNHPGTRWAPKRVPCSHCRWTDLLLFRQDERKRFVVVRVGVSDVPEERDLVSVSVVDTSFELVEALVSADRTTGRRTMSNPPRWALAQAASHDADVRDVYLHSPLVQS